MFLVQPFIVTKVRRGFGLKFKQRILQQRRKCLEFELKEPLRWREDDKLEPLLMCFYCLIVKMIFGNIIEIQFDVHIKSLNQQALLTQIADFYGLLFLAHYRTSPIDLRRLLDAPKQRFYLAQTEGHLLGGVWALEEGDCRIED